MIVFIDLYHEKGTTSNMRETQHCHKDVRHTCRPRHSAREFFIHLYNPATNSRPTLVNRLPTAPPQKPHGKSDGIQIQMRAVRACRSGPRQASSIPGTSQDCQPSSHLSHGQKVGSCPRGTGDVLSDPGAYQHTQFFFSVPIHSTTGSSRPESLLSSHLRGGIVWP